MARLHTPDEGAAHHRVRTHESDAGSSVAFASPRRPEAPGKRGAQAFVAVLGFSQPLGREAR
jgi:hypothetical protein